MAAVRIRAIDENGNVLPYYQEPVQIKVEGPGQLIGPDIVSLKGGMGGTYVKTLGEKGIIKISISSVQSEPAVIAMKVTEVCQG